MKSNRIEKNIDYMYLTQGKELFIPSKSLLIDAHGAVAKEQSHH